ncbi:MAG: hypothetical protein JOY72_03570 [Actinobacteria bacterium]|nr:hypothetical protein [Actinomycetota bacterium]
MEPGLTETQDPTVVGGDTISAGKGNDLIFGGPGVDGITAGGGNDTIFGDDGSVNSVTSATQTIDPGVGDVDTILAGNGNDLVFGGAAGDSITAGGGNDIVFGDDGIVAPNLVKTLDAGVGGADTIQLGNGNDEVFGGTAGDTITVGNGTDTVFGDDGSITPGLATTISDNDGGKDSITSGNGNDFLFGGLGNDTIVDSGGHNVVFGDSGKITWSGANLTDIEPLDPTLGGPDSITISGAGSNYVIGGAGGDTINTGASDDLIFGDFGQIAGTIPPTLPVPSAPTTFTYTSVFAQNMYGGGNDTINAGDGRNIVIGGQGNDTITSGSGDDDLIGGNNVAGGQDGSDTIDGGAGNDVICGDNCSILPEPAGTTDPIDQTLTGSTIYTTTQNADGTVTITPNLGGATLDPRGALQRAIVLYDYGTTDSTLYGNDYLAGGAGDDMIFGEMGNDVIQGDGSTSINVGTYANPGQSVNSPTDGNDYIEGGPGNDLIFGDGGQDDIIGGSSGLFLPAGSPRPDGSDVIFGGAGTEISLNNPGDSGANAHSSDADVILGDNGDIYDLVGSGGNYLHYSSDDYAGEAIGIIPRAVVLLDYSPTGDASYTQCDPTNPANCTVHAGTNTNIGGADVIHGEGGNDVIYGETGDDQLFGDGQDDVMYGNSGNDFMDGGTGNDGMLGDDGLIEPSRNGIAEPLFNLPATTQVTLGTGDGDEDDIVTTVDVYDTQRYTAILTTPLVGGNDIMFGGLGNDSMHGGAGDDAMSGAAPLAYYYGNGLNPLGIIDSIYTPGNVLGFNPATGIFAYYNPSDPYSKIMVPTSHGLVDFLLNFVSTVDDGSDAIFGDDGNDWIVGGTNSDYMFGGFGNDLLQADDNLDSTLVTQTVTYASLCTLAQQYAASGSQPNQANNVCNELVSAQQAQSQGHTSDMLNHLVNFENMILDDPGPPVGVFTGDEAATLLNLVQALMGTSPLANNIPDPRSSGPSNADFAYGGAGTDILIGNTSADTLIDWNQPNDAVFVLPFQGNGHPNTVIHDPNPNNAQVVLDIALALGDDPLTTGDPARDGEPYGELGMVEPGDALWPSPPNGPGPSLGQRLQQALPALETHQDEDTSETLPAVQLTPALQLTGPNLGVPGVDQYDQALINRIAILGRLTPSDVAWVVNNIDIPQPGHPEIGQLLAKGLVIWSNGSLVASPALQYDLGLADAPVISNVTMSSTPTTGMTVSGTGDAGDTITIYDGSTVVGHATVGANDTWTTTLYLPVGQYELFATQTVNLPPNAGLTSALSHDVDNVMVVPDAPVVVGAVTATGGVKVSGTGAAGDVVTLYDNGHQVGTATVASNGTWTLTLSLQSGIHGLTASQVAPGNFKSATGNALAITTSGTTVSGYAAPGAPTISSVTPPQPTSGNTNVTVTGTGIANDTVVVYDNGVCVGQTRVASNGTWSLNVNLAVGRHALTASQYLVAGLPGASTAAWNVTVYAPTPQPAVYQPSFVTAGHAFTLVGSGVAGDTILVYDGTTYLGTTTVGANGVWSLSNVTLASGKHTLTATQTDPASHLVSNGSQSVQLSL